MTRRTNLLTAASVLGLGLLLAACGGSSSDSAATTTSPPSTAATTTTIPTATQVVAACNAAENAIQPIAEAIEAGGSTMDFATLDDLVEAAVAPAQNCQTTMQASIPGLPAAAQGPAGQFASATGQIIALLKAPPTEAAAVPGWAAQLQAVVNGPGGAAKAALAAADPTFAP